MMVRIEQDGIEVEFVGWTNFNNEKFKDIDNTYSSASFLEKEILNRGFELGRKLIVSRLKDKGIQISGVYHQAAAFGCPVIKINDFGTFKFACTQRFWGEMMADAGYGKTHLDWAWANPPGKEEISPLLKEKSKWLI